VRIAVTGPAEAAERLAGVLAATGAAEPGSLTAPVVTAKRALSAQYTQELS
jgi:hypothetical protein